MHVIVACGSRIADNRGRSSGDANTVSLGALLPTEARRAKRTTAVLRVSVSLCLCVSAVKHVLFDQPCELLRELAAVGQLGLDAVQQDSGIRAADAVALGQLIGLAEVADRLGQLAGAAFQV